MRKFNSGDATQIMEISYEAKIEVLASNLQNICQSLLPNLGLAEVSPRDRYNESGLNETEHNKFRYIFSFRWLFPNVVLVALSWLV